MRLVLLQAVECKFFSLLPLLLLLLLQLLHQLPLTALLLLHLIMCPCWGL